jgi:hypothetical protein
MGHEVTTEGDKECIPARSWVEMRGLMQLQLQLQMQMQMQM